MAIFGSLSTVRSQLARADHFQATFAYLNESFTPGTAAYQRVRAVAVGKSERVELTGGAFALEQAYMSKPRAEGFFESHKVFIDVQVVVEGEEFIEIVDVTKLTVKEDKTPAKDMITYQMSDAVSPVRLSAGEAAVLYPVDGHMPGVAIKEPTLIRKIVVKVPVA